MANGPTRIEVSPQQVAMLCQGDEVYGVGTVLRMYAKLLPDVSFVALGDGPLVEWLRGNGNRVDVVPGMVRFSEGGPSLWTLLKSPSVLARARRDAAKIDALLRGRGIRIIHAHWRPQQIIAGFLRRRGYASAWHIHYTMNPRRLMGLGVRLNHAMAKWGADLLLPVSKFIGSNWHGSGVPSAVIYNAAEPCFPGPNRLPESPVRCIIAGRMEHSKGHHLAVETVMRARKSGIDVRLDVFGGPLENNAYADDLRQRVSQADCEPAIQFKGFQTGMRQHHQEYHLGLQCRIDPEPCSVWVCETLVDGLPLVASSTGGTPELVEEGVTGLLFRTEDVADMTDKLLSLLKEPARLHDMRRRAYERGNRLFTPDRFARDTIAAYQIIGSQLRP
jgi:glycosyltransferase involved in cell wall biosynthesis